MKIRYRYLIFFVLLQLLFIGRAFASNVIVFNDRDSRYALTNVMSYLEDPGSDLTIDDAASERMSHLYTTTGESIFNFGYTTSSYWFKATLAYRPISDTHTNKIYRSSIQEEWLLEMDHPQFERVELYIPNNEGGFSVKKAGKDQRLSERDIHHVNSVFKLPVLNEAPITLYFKIKNDSAFIVSFFVWSPSAFMEKVEVEAFFYGILYGSMLVMLLYNFFVYLSVRDKSYLYYVLYVTSMIMFEFIVNAHGITLFGDNVEPLNKQFLPLCLFGSWFSIMQLARYFLDTKLLYPSLDQFLRLFTYFTVAGFIFSWFIPLNDTLQWLVISTFVYIVLLPSVALYCWLKGNVAARYFFFAWLVHLLGVVIYIMSIIGVLPAGALILSVPLVALVVELILLSFSLADRIKVIQKEALTANESAMQHLKHYRSVFNNAIEGLYQMSLADRFITANPALVQLLGYASQGDLKAGNVVAMNACFSDPQVREQVINDLREHGIIQDVEAQYQRQNGEYYWASHSAQVIMGKEGKVSHIEGTFVDITEQKEKEKALKGREKAREKEEVAKATANAKSSFLANMSHEIRTPLTAIIGYSESLRDAQLTKEESIHSIDTVVRSSHHLLNLINDILDFSKIEANKLDVENIQVDVMPLISEIQSYFGMNAHEKGLEFTTNLTFPLPRHINTDPTRLKQVLMNLCSNALKFTQKGSVRVDVSCNASDKMFCFKITDTGIGLNKEQVEGLFDAFSQADSTKTRGYGGTGLGLSISKQLAELMGGDIQVQSTPSLGSQFILSVDSGDLEDVDWVNTESDARLVSSNQKEALVVPALSGHILYAEDSPENQQLVALLLKNTGVKLTLVKDGREAVEKVASEEFDVILMDIQMPIKNGIEATQALRESGYQKPIIAFTANVMNEDIALYTEIGCDTCLGKPVDRALFYKTLDHYIGIDTPAVETNAGEPTSIFSGRVLLAEDNIDNQSLMSQQLKRLGLNVVIANNGEEAVEQAMEQEFDIVLMNINMPIMNGIDATEMLRMTGYSKPIYALTLPDKKVDNQADDQTDVEKCLAAGCEGYLIKPLETDKLFDVLTLVVGPAKVDAHTRADKNNTMLNSQTQNVDPDMQALIDCFCEGLPDYLSKIESAYDNEDWESLQDLAHQLKGSAGSFGFPELTLKAKAVELALKKAQMADVPSNYSVMKHEITEILKKID